MGDIIAGKRISNLRVFINLGIFFVLLSYGYYFFFYILQNSSAVIGFELSVNYFKLVEALALIFILALFYVYNDINDSVYMTFSYVYYLFVFVPTGVYYWLTNNARPYIYMQFAAFALLNLIYVLYKRYFHRENEGLAYGMSGSINEGLGSRKYLYLFVGIIVLFMIGDFLMYLRYGNSLSYLIHPSTTEQLRVSVRGTIPGKLTYIINWSAYAIIPACVAWCLKTKKYYLIIIPVILQALAFTINGAKANLLSLALGIFVFALYSRRLTYYLLICLNYLLALTLLLKNVYGMAVIIRRTFIFPQSISFNYYKFFTQFPKMNLSNSILSHFFTNAYRLDSPFIISRYVYRQPLMSANGDYIANAYSNFGFIGIILFTILLGAVLIAIEYSGQRSANKKYLVLITFSTLFALANSALLTTMMNHGLIISVILGYIFIRAYKRN